MFDVEIIKTLLCETTKPGKHFLHGVKARGVHMTLYFSVGQPKFRFVTTLDMTTWASPVRHAVKRIFAFLLVQQRKHAFTLKNLSIGDGSSIHFGKRVGAV